MRTTRRALLALWNLAGEEHLDSARAGFQWLLDQQNKDGGIPTFCRGWGTLPFDRSATDLTAHAIGAWSVWRPAPQPDLEADRSGGSARLWRYEELYPVLLELTSLSRVPHTCHERPPQIFDLGFTARATCA